MKDFIDVLQFLKDIDMESKSGKYLAISIGSAALAYGAGYLINALHAAGVL